MDTVEYVKQFPLKKFTRGEILVQKGDPNEFLMAVRSGFLKVTSIGMDGTERLIWIAGRYDLAPIEKLFSKKGASKFFYTALTDGSYYQLDKTAFVEEASKSPKLMGEIARGMSEHYDDLLQHIDALDTSSVRDRLLLTLMYLAERLSGERDVDLFSYGLVLTHADFANLIGSTRETTSLTLNSLRKEGYISYSRNHCVVHVEKIRTLFED
ncbi:MAG: Crp/Fnr family transcriptional regulator [Candidatus Microsaccharimonas sp.]